MVAPSTTNFLRGNDWFKQSLPTPKQYDRLTKANQKKVQNYVRQAKRIQNSHYIKRRKTRELEELQQRIKQETGDDLAREKIKADERQAKNIVEIMRGIVDSQTSKPIFTVRSLKSLVNEYSETILNVDTATVQSRIDEYIYYKHGDDSVNAVQNTSGRYKEVYQYSNLVSFFLSFFRS